MKVDAVDNQNKLIKYDKVNGPAFKIYNDPRFTKVGKFLSHTGLDEIPQLVIVIRGGMSIIGPSPLPTKEIALLDPRQQQRRIVNPGIISPWVLNRYHSNSFDEWMKSDINYFQRITLCIIHTVVKSI